MRLKFSLLLLFLLTVRTGLPAKTDSLTLLNRFFKNHSAEQNFSNEQYRNPAMHYDKHSSSLSELSTGGMFRKDSESIVPQKGNGQTDWIVNAQGFICLNRNTRIWGTAGYNSGKRSQQQWNESADFDWIYPFVTADTIGGDMQFENYHFTGGYARQSGKWTMGFEVSYSALSEFRKVDPRAYNISDFLQGKAGVSYLLGNNYRAGIGTTLGKYKQRSDIRYYNELGVSKTYHLSGMAMSYQRFDGTETNPVYQGILWDVSAQLTPGHQGWSAVTNWETFICGKTLPGRNNIRIQQLNRRKIYGELAYKRHREHNRQIWKIAVRQEHRTGTEFLFGEATGNAYPQIGQTVPFASSQFNGILSFLSEHESGDSKWSLEPTVGYSCYRESYANPYAEMHYAHWLAGLSGSYVRLHGKHMWTISGQASISPAANSHLTENPDFTTPFALEILTHTYRIRSNGHSTVSFLLQWSKPVSKRLAIIAAISAESQYYWKLADSHTVTCKTGIIF